MNDNTVYDIDFTRALPAPLKNDEKMLALGKTIAGELQENIHMARQTIIYPRIDELPENLLDILAHDFKVDWWNPNFTIDEKRQILKDSWAVHRRLGTKYAMVTALRGVFPQTGVKEWFEYGGEPFCFRITIDLTAAKTQVNYFQVVREAEYYKRLSAHLDGVSSHTALPHTHITIHSALRPYRRTTLN